MTRTLKGKLAIGFIASVTLVSFISPTLATTAQARERAQQETVYAEDNRTLGEIAVHGQQISEVTKSTSVLTNSATEQVEMNDLAVEMNRELSNMTMEEVLENIEEILQKFDGAEFHMNVIDARLRTPAGVAIRIQNGGWNTFYNSAAGRQAVHRLFDRIAIGAGTAGALSAIVATAAKASGVGIPAGVLGVIASILSGGVVARSLGAANLVSRNGNVGTVRVTLTQHLWSRTFDNTRW